MITKMNFPSSGLLIVWFYPIVKKSEPDEKDLIKPKIRG